MPSAGSVFCLMSEVVPQAQSEAVDQRGVAAFAIYQGGMRLSWAVLIAAGYLPIHAAVPVAQALAGRHTSFDMGVSLTVGITVTLGGLAGLVARNRQQRGEIKRLRGRVEQLESQLTQGEGQ